MHIIKLSVIAGDSWHSCVVVGYGGVFAAVIAAISAASSEIETAKCGESVVSCCV